jgi:DNA-directed RNA polymerase specialized sigma24 family protein
MKIEEKGIEYMTKRLDVIIALLATIATKDENTTLRDKILMLDGFGLKSSEIASVLNKKAGYVSKELSVARSKK